jgi:hypothetical protein
MILSDEQLDRMSRGWTPSEVRELIRQHKLALQTLDALAVFVPPREKKVDVETIAAELRTAGHQPADAKFIAKGILRKLALPNSEVHVAIRHFREQVEANAPEITTIGGHPACTTPSGRTDSHGKWIKMVCAFCGGRLPPSGNKRKPHPSDVLRDSKSDACACDDDEQPQATP